MFNSGKQELLKQRRATSFRIVIKILCVFLFIFPVQGNLLYAQKNIHIVKGIIVDKTSKEAIASATISLTSEKDSSLRFMIVSSSGGRFEIAVTDTGGYQLKATYQSSELLSKKIYLAANTPVLNLDTIYTDRLYHLMAEVIVKEKSPVKMKGDTVAYKAGNYTTAPNATVEDLLKKLPGVQVDKTGAVKAQGEQVQKVYVDGKEFFGDNPTMATKNLTADMIEQVQVFNDKTEQSKLTNIEDGTRIKAINLKLKQDKKKGMFGTAVAGYGTDNRYHAGISANYFQSATQLSLITGSSNLSPAAAISPVQMASPGNLNALTGSNRNGLNETSSVGLNYHSFIGKQLDINASYQLLDENHKNQRIAFRQAFFKDSMITTDRTSDYFSKNKTHRLNLKITYALDSFNTIVYTPVMMIGKTESTYSDLFSDQVHRDSSYYLSAQNQNSSNGQEKPTSVINQLAWRKKFNRAGRSFMAALVQTYNQNDRNMYTDILSKAFNRDSILQRQLDKKFYTDFETGNNNYGITLSYTEPAGKGKWLEINYNYANNKSRIDRNTWSYNAVTQAYDKKEDTLTNDVHQLNRWSTVGANLKGIYRKLHYQVGMAWQQVLLESEERGKNLLLAKQFTNILPLASFNYQFGSGRSLQLQYRGRSNQPDIRQMQNFVDITSYPYIQKGNPALRQEFVHTANLSYNAFNSARLQSMFIHITYNNIRNRITSSLQQHDAEQVWMPVNLNGAYSLNASVALGFPFFSVEGASLNTNTQMDFYRNVSLVNNTRNNTSDVNIGQEISLNYNSGHGLDLGVSLNAAYNKVSYVIGEMQNTSFFTHSISVNSTYSFSKGLMVSTQVDYMGYTGSRTPLATNYFLWKASIDKNLLRNGRGSVKLTLHDILNSNENISRIKGSNYTEDAKNLTLQRFAVLSFIYRFNKTIR